MRNTVTYQSLTFDDDRLTAMQSAVDTSLSGRELNVDTMELTVETGAVAGGFFTASQLPFFTKSGLRFSLGSVATLDGWSQADPLLFFRGGSQYQRWYPRMVKRVAPNKFAISSTSSLGRLTQMTHRGGIYVAQPAGPLIREICGDVPVYIQPNLENIALYGFLPYVSPSGTAGARTGSAKDNLLQVLIAINAPVRDDASGTLRIENLSTEVSSVLDEDRIYRKGASVEDDVLVTSLTLIEHQYIQGSESKELFSGTTTEGQVIVFSEPCNNLAAQGFNIEASGANFAVVSSGTGTLTGVPYVHAMREITRSVSKSAAENPVRIEDATLVSITNSADVANRLVAYYQCRKTIHIDATIQFEDAGDVVSIFDPFDKIMRTATIEQISPLNVSHTMKGSLVARVDFTPWQTIPFEDVREIITEGTSWTAPADLQPGTEITVIAIGGGDGGFDGESGANGGSNSNLHQFPEYETGSVSTTAQPGGAGGKGGAAGAGGKIARGSLLVDPSEVITMKIGAGGAPNGGVGGETVFGGISSTSGEASEAGFVDPITGSAYARPGAEGITGADGGSGGSAGSKGTAGQDSESFSGGPGGSGYTSVRQLDAVYCGGGGGSGAGADRNGTRGGNGTFTASLGNRRGDLTSVGGAGVAGKDGEEKTQFGDGGDGGSGGSGGGGAGAARYTKTGAMTVVVTAYCTGTGGVGGSGGKGSAGAPGCVILIYRRPIAM